MDDTGSEPRGAPLGDLDVERLLPLYLAGRATLAERARVESWVAADPSHRVALDRLTAAWRAAADTTPVVGKANAWRAIQGAMRAERVAQGTDALAGVGSREQRTPRMWAGGRALPSARGVLLAVGATAVILGVWISGRSRRSPAGFGGRVYATAPGQRETVTLPDGSRLTLAPGTRLRVPLDYGSAGRTVAVDGEVMFAVVHDDRHPFAVRVRNTVTTDVGTRFDVRAYAEDPSVRVAVQEGRVAVTTPGNSVSLSARDVAIVTASGATSVAHNLDVSPLTAWTRGELVFDRVPLAAVVAQLSRWYGLDLQLADSALGAQALTLTLADESPAEAVDAVAAILSLRMDRRGPLAYTLYRKDR